MSRNKKRNVEAITVVQTRNDGDRAGVTQAQQWGKRGFCRMYVGSKGKKMIGLGDGVIARDTVTKKGELPEYPPI